MDKTIAISLGGFSFTIDENAYKKLKTYLEEIRFSLNNMEGTDEIMSDVEIRIAELFKEKLNHREVVNVADIDGVVEIMGKPEQYMNEETESDPTFVADPSTAKTKKKLFRDTDQKILGGVLSGLAHYLGVETWVTRVIFIALVFADVPLTGTSFTVVSYIILWVILPKAVTTAQKYEMHGRTANFENIKQNVSETATALKGSASTLSTSFDEILRVFARLVLAFFGFLFLCIGLSLLVGAIVTLFTYNMVPLNFFGYIIDFGWQSWVAKAILFVLLMIPSLLFSLIGARMISSRVKINKTLVIVAIITWFVSLIAGSFLGLSLAKNFMNEIEFSEKNAYSLPQDTLTIGIKDYYLVGDRKMKILNELNGYMEFDGQLHRKNKKEIEVLPSNDDQLWVEITFFSKGKSYDDARENAEHIDYKYQLKDNGELLLDEYILLGKSQKMRDQSISIRLFVPKNKVIYFKDIRHARFLAEHNHTSTYENVKHKTYAWQNGEFICQDCSEKEASKVKIAEEGIHIEKGSKKLIINQDKIEISNDTNSIEPTDDHH